MPKKVTLETLAERMDQGFDVVNKRFDAQDKKLKTHDRGFDLIDRKLNNQDKRFDNFGQAILNLVDDMKDVKENMVIKKDLDEVNDGLDKQMVILLRLDQERIFTIERIKRLEAEVGRIKQHLGIS